MTTDRNEVKMARIGLVLVLLPLAAVAAIAFAAWGLK
jgi:hypothetical protein